MINVNLLKSEIVKNGFTQKSVAEGIGMTPQTFTRKLRRGVFGTDEVESILKLLNIGDPTPIFFANNVTSKVTRKE